MLEVKSRHKIIYYLEVFGEPQNQAMHSITGFNLLVFVKKFAKFGSS
jgi:RNase P/RNase MRP subunit p30